MATSSLKRSTFAQAPGDDSADLTCSGDLVKAKTTMLLSKHDLLITAPDELRTDLAGLKAKPLLRAYAA